MKKIAYFMLLILTFFGLAEVAFAEEPVTITCPEAATLNQAFQSKWEWLPERQRYFSILIDQFSSALRTDMPALPENNGDPQLSYLTVQLGKIYDRHLWNIGCLYRIGTPHISASPDGYAHLSANVDLSRKCVITGPGRVVCS